MSRAAELDRRTAELHAAIAGAEPHAALIRRIEARLASAPPAARPRAARIAVVPGALHRSRPETGADGREFIAAAAALGFACELVPVGEEATPAENGAIVRDWLAARAGGGPLILVSLSKGGADVKMALARPGAAAAFAPVRTWINACGVLDGTPLADWLLSAHPLALLNRLWLAARGRSLRVMTGIRRDAGDLAATPLVTPPGLELISAVGFPQRAHLAPGLNRRCRDRLAARGPSDGAVLLEDFRRLPGLLFPLWGVDHFLRPRHRSLAALCALADDAESRLRGAAGSARGAA